MPKNAHTELVNATILKLGATEYCRCWKNHVGTAVRVSWVKKLQTIHGYQIPADQLMKGLLYYGQLGSADITGILSNGLSLWIECKTGTGSQTKVQRNFEKMIQKFRGVYMVVRPGDPVLDWVISAAQRK